jgi:hypothetical protein
MLPPHISNVVPCSQLSRELLLAAVAAAKLAASSDGYYHLNPLV